MDANRKLLIVDQDAQSRELKMQLLELAGLQPTAVESSWQHAGTYGAGARATVATPHATSADFAIELARQQTNLPGIADDWRVNVTAGLRF